VKLILTKNPSFNKMVSLRHVKKMGCFKIWHLKNFHEIGLESLPQKNIPEGILVGGQ